MCVCVCWLLSVYNSDPPTDHQVITWRTLPTSVASQQRGALVLAYVSVAVIVCSCLFSQGGVHVSRVSGVSSCTMLLAACLPLPLLSEADWSEVITGPLWLKTRDINEASTLDEPQSYCCLSGTRFTFP